MTETAVHFDRLRKVYGGLFGKTVEALRGITIQVERGQIFGLLGPNGAGKTTAVKLLLGLCRATGGSATVFGEPAGTQDARRKIGYMPERPILPSHLSGQKALEHFGALSGLSRAERREQAGKWLERMGLGHVGNQKVGTYSKGMGQRIGIAQALLHDPPLVVLDEPTDGLDPVGRREIRELLFEMKKKGTTVFLNSHLLQEVEECCDRVAILHKGEIVRGGTLEELLAVQAEYQLTMDGMTDAAKKKLKEIAVEVDDGATKNELVVRLEAESHVDKVVDALRADNVGIRGVVPIRRRLEDIFVDALGGDTSVGGHPAGGE